MFRRIAGNNANTLFQLHPVELSGLLEFSWERRRTGPPPYGDLNNRSIIESLPPSLISLIPRVDANRTILVNLRTMLGTRISVVWDHLIYAFCIENTRTYEIFRKVIFEYLHGEKLGAPSPGAQAWLRNTEELFYRDPAPYVISSLTSHIRPDLNASRRNAYYRMFGMDLNHGGPDDKPIAYHKAKIANTQFIATLEEFLYEIWVGISNENNTSGARPTDNAAIADLARKLYDMLMTRRQNGNLARQEFFYVAMMSWFHMTLETPDAPILLSLRAEASSPEERLFKIAERVGVPAHAKSGSFFDLAEPLSRILIAIELGTYNNEANVQALYTPGPIEADIRRIITEWSNATGRNVKSRKVTATVAA